FCLIYPLIQGRESGWPWWSFGLLLLSGIILWLFIYDQRRKKAAGKAPLIDTSLFKFRDLNIGLGAVLFHFMVHTSYLLLSAVFLQNGLGLSPLTSGLYFVVPGILFTLSSVAASRLIPRYGTRVLMVGVVLIVITFGLEIAYFESGASVAVLFTLQ